VEMDCYYVQNWSLGLDIKILLQTPVKVLKGEGAY
jgi:putative colanic acid biosynthesis UDP-glucose lipid carrier transferase